MQDNEYLEYLANELNRLQPKVDLYNELVGRQLQKNDNKLLSIAGAARALGVARETIETMLEDPALPRIFVGKSNQVRLQYPSLVKYVRNRASNWYKYAPKGE